MEYWASQSKLTPLDETLVIKHLVHLSDLTPVTTYQFKIMSRDKVGNLAVSDEYTFPTLGAPAAFDVSMLRIIPDRVDIGQEVTISVVFTVPAMSLAVVK